MTPESRQIVGFMVRHAAFGFGLAAVFVTAVIWTDVGRLGTLIAASPEGWLAAALLFFFTGLSFSSVQTGIAIMQYGRADGGRRGGRPSGLKDDR